MNDGQNISTNIDMKAAFTEVAADKGMQVAATAPQAMTPSQMMGGTKMPATVENARKLGLG